MRQMNADVSFEPQIHRTVLVHNMLPTGNRLTMMFSAIFQKKYRELQVFYLIPTGTAEHISDFKYGPGGFGCRDFRQFNTHNLQGGGARKLAFHLLSMDPI
ncbi:uncharacterized protein LOC143243998 isoform X1 [Tachypleus tridentatus]|uniref:uncharacterized protein LOC143243998 isoform X1 n=1 Tax=Tachypleus tridentatus TaxID=6853 RepID=UPI003FD1826A